MLKICGDKTTCEDFYVEISQPKSMVDHEYRRGGVLVC